MAFLVAAPYTLLDLPGFLNGFARLANEYRVTPPESASIVYFKLLLRHAFQWPALLLAAGGLGLGIVRLVRGPGRVRWALAVVFPVLYLWMIRGQGLVYGRYLLPIVPPLCILAATAVVSGVSLLRRYEIPRAPRTALIAALTIAALLPPALVSIKWDRDAARTSTVDLAYAWILQHVPQQSLVAIESRALLLPATYRSRNVLQLRQHGLRRLARSEGRLPGRVVGVTTTTTSGRPRNTRASTPSTCASSSRAASSCGSRRRPPRPDPSCASSR